MHITLKSQAQHVQVGAIMALKSFWYANRSSCKIGSLEGL